MFRYYKKYFTLFAGFLKVGKSASILLFLSSPLVFAQSDQNAGLWVGEALVSHVSEVSVPLDENNVPRAPDPNNPTPTHDLASLRLILHVDSSGKVRFLKDVAILKPSRVTNDAGLDQDIALITDPSIYSSFSDQPGQRIATAAFDFGDQKTSEVLTKLMDEAVGSAATQGNDSAITTANLQTFAYTAAVTAAETIRDNADLNKAFYEYVTNNLTSVNLDSKVSSGAQAFTTPTLEQENSPFNDTRAKDMVTALNVVINNNSLSETEKGTKLHNTAASYVDVNREYDRFISGSYFSQMIQAAAKKAASEKIADNASTKDGILALLNTVNQVNDAEAEAIKIRVEHYGYQDSRGKDAIDEVLEDIADKAISTAEVSLSSLENILINEGSRSLANDVLRYPSPSKVPSPEYNSFISSNSFTGAPEKAASAASKAVHEERSTNTFATQASYTAAAKIAVANELKSAFSAAARANVSELLMSGSMSSTASLIINLPAMHPTNPFRHRRNPGHVQGFDITRVVTLTFGQNANDKITGTYEEEIKGLHKPLGPDKNLGLKVEGTFELNRVSKVDTLNGN